MQYKSYGSVAFSAHSTFYVSLARLLEFSGFLWTSSSFHYIGVSQNKLGGMVCAIENLASNFVTFVKNSFKIENLVQLYGMVMIIRLSNSLYNRGNLFCHKKFMSHNAEVYNSQGSFTRSA